MTDEESDWQPTTGADLSQILALPGYEAQLQAALDAARADRTRVDWRPIAASLLTEWGVEASAVVEDLSTGKPQATSRIEVLAEELLRACFEEG